MARITINGISFDPTAPGPATAALAETDAADSDYVLVQTSSPPTEAQLAQLQKLGVVVLEHVSENTLLCGFKPESLSKVRALKFVTWAGVYMQNFKIPPNLREPVAATASIVPQEAETSTRRTLRKVDVVLQQDVDSSDAELKKKLAAAARINPEDLTMSRHKVRLQVQERYLNDLSAIDEVRHVEEVPARKLFNNFARTIMNANVAMNGTTFEGDGELVAVADTGFDRGSSTNVHPAFTGRVVKLVPFGRPGRTDDPDGHGTHVCGSVLGNGNSPSMGGVIQGTAPKAKLIVQSLLDDTGGLGGIPDDLHNLFKPAFDDNARVHTNSWGATTPGLPYSQSSNEIDDFVFNHPDCVICFAAGNDGIDRNRDGIVDEGQIGSEAAAKNCITVGASENNRPDLTRTYGSLRPNSFPHSPLFSDRMADNPSGMAAFSSRGPTKERRLKPDVVAPGTGILSTLSRVAQGSVIFGPSSDPAFFFEAGTSMATPLVAGCCAVLRESLVKNGIARPSAALIKALLINGAVPLSGQYTPPEVSPPPNNVEGWGRVDLAGSLIVPDGDPNAGLVEDGPLRQGEERMITIKVPAGRGGLSLAGGRKASKKGKRKGKKSTSGVGTMSISPTFKITLVWSDPAGATLQNDLDLIVKASDGQERHGNMGTLSGFDRVNNVEQVVWENIPPGDIKVTVRAFRITRFPQAFALAWRIS
jgi:serine protease AprX